MKAKLIACNVPTSNAEPARKFYSALFGVESARSFSDQVESYHIPISNHGEWLWISHRTAADEQITCVFAVENLERAMADLSNAGGKAFVQPFDAPISPKLIKTYAEALAPDVQVTPTMGRFALMRDPDNNVIGLMQPEEHAHQFFGLGKYAAPVNVIAPLADRVLETHQRVLEIGKRTYG
jgi:predicted enzyme related to lactoylglutathione lyase